MSVVWRCQDMSGIRSSSHAAVLEFGWMDTSFRQVNPLRVQWNYWSFNFCALYVANWFETLFSWPMCGDDWSWCNWHSTGEKFPMSMLTSLMSGHLVCCIPMQARELYHVTPVKELVDLKWRSYGSAGFGIFFLVNAFYLVVLTLVAYYRPLTYSPCPSPDSPKFDAIAEVNYTAPNGTSLLGCTPLRPVPFKVVLYILFVNEMTAHSIFTLFFVKPRDEKEGTAWFVVILCFDSSLVTPCFGWLVLIFDEVFCVYSEALLWTTFWLASPICLCHVIGLCSSECTVKPAGYIVYRSSSKGYHDSCQWSCIVFRSVCSVCLHTHGASIHTGSSWYPPSGCRNRVILIEKLWRAFSNY